MKEVGVLYNGTKITVEFGAVSANLKIDDNIVNSGKYTSAIVLCGVMATGERVTAVVYSKTMSTGCVIQVNGLTVYER